MDGFDFFWGLVVVIAGVFISVYGLMLFKFALAAMGFGAGFIGMWWLLGSQGDTARILVSLVAGAIGAVVLYSLVRFGVYVAGALLGVVIAFIIGGLIEIIGPSVSNPVMWILGLGGLAGGGLFGHRIGQMVVLLATSATGAFLIIDGFQIWATSGAAESVNPASLLGDTTALAMFVTIFAISGLSQYNTRGLIRRVVN